MSAIDYATEGDLWGVLAETYGSVMSELLFVGIVCSLVLLAIYLNSRSITLTAVTAMLSGAVVVQYLPPEVQNAGYLLILAAAAAVATSIYMGQGRRQRV